MNTTALVVVLLLGLVFWWLATRNRKKLWGQGSPHAGGMYGTWRSATGGMSRPFFSSPWFILFVIAAILVWLVLA